MKKGCPFGTHRVIEPKGVLPQPAWKIDNTMEIYDNEILIDVQRLNIDSASFTQIKEEVGKDPEKIAAKMLSIVGERGKHHNPVTGSGGMLIGTVEQIGPALEGKTDLKVGDRIATLVSLSLTPLRIDEVKKVYVDKDQADIKGKAILFESGIYAKLPDDMDDALALAVLDVAGAPAQTAKLVKPGDTVLLIGGAGKSGLLCLAEARKHGGITSKIIVLGYSKEQCAVAESLGLADHVIVGDATDAVGTYEKIKELTNGELCDLTINMVNVPNTEMASIMCTKDSGTVYFFSMATSFTKAALGAEGIGKEPLMIIGNGYTKHHAEISLQTVRENPAIRKIFQEKYV